MRIPTENLLTQKLLILTLASHETEVSVCCSSNQATANKFALLSASAYICHGHCLYLNEKRGKYNE